MKTHKTKTRIALLGLCALGSSLTYAQMLTVGVYDPATQANRVDNDILNPGTIITAQPTGAIGVAEFTTNVADAFANNMGGVIDFESGSLGQQAHFGVDGSLRMTPTFTGWGGLESNNNNGRIPISGTTRLNGPSDGTASITFGSFSDALGNPLPGYKVSQVGITMIARDDRLWTGTVTATFSDLTTASYSIVGLGNYGTPSDLLNPPEDTFLGFTAPAGQGITGISFARTAGGNFTLNADDLGIVAIPEPGTLMLLGLALGTLLLFRRRK
ncbi:MAG: PEP-CTERM sorting domain-containing protein [Verrucomicrobia bacterium]|nr:PEP-CTERM sorting domain-containing protein [Verrucomicrobiota bacterium]MCH8511849.1 PEP-CTERM sorting domain-containing protein [Kiritimatiellia bacterium]